MTWFGPTVLCCFDEIVIVNAVLNLPPVLRRLLAFYQFIFAKEKKIVIYLLVIAVLAVNRPDADMTSHIYH